MQHTLKHAFLHYVMLGVLGMIGISCYILADTFFVARGLGPDALAALNIAIPAYSIMSGIGQMIGVGGATRYSVCRVQGDETGASRFFTHAVLLGLACGLAFTLSGILYPARIARLLGADPSVFPLTFIYLRTLLCFGPCFILNSILLAFVRNDGAPDLSMQAMLAGSFSNILFDYIFIFPCGMGMFGAAFATGASPIFSMLVLTRHLRRPSRGFRLVRGHIQLRLLGTLCTPGISSLIAELSSGVVLLLFNLVLLRIAGNTGIAAYGIIANFSLVAVSVFTGAAQGMQPLISSFYGKCDFASLKRLFRYGAVFSLCVSTALYTLLFAGAGPLTAAFNSTNDPILADYAVSGLRLYFIGFWFAGINILSAAFFSAAGHTRKGFILSLIRGLIAVLPLLPLLSTLLGINGVWLTFPAVEGVTALFTALFSVRYFRGKA